MRASHLIRFTLAALLACLPACSREKTTAGTALFPATGGVAATNYPLAWIAGHLLDGALPVEFHCPPDEDPAHWQPDEAAILAMQKARLILLNGAGYEPWLQTVTLPEDRLVDTSASFAGSLVTIEDAVTHSHGPGGAHTHSGTAFTTWLDLDQAARQAAAVRDALLPLLDGAEARAGLEARAEALVSELRALDGRLATAGRKLGGTPLLGSHPVYQYLARRYGLNLLELHWEPDEVPDAKVIADLKTKLEKHPARWMLWEDDPLPESVELLKEMGISSATFAPAANQPDEGDFLSIMQANAKALEGVADAGRP
jgi:zinc transport system substrate-binding protein